MFWYSIFSLAMAECDIQQGIEILRSGDASKAETVLTACTVSEPSNIQAWWELGWARWKQDDFTGAVVAWETVEKIDASWPDVTKWLTQAKQRATYSETVYRLGSVPTEAIGTNITIVAAGDTMMGTSVRKGNAGLASGNGEELFIGVTELFQKADISFLNLEGPLADDHIPVTKCGPKSTSCYAFRTPTRYVQALSDMGLDVASLANNHAMDAGTIGMESTMQALDSKGIAHAGRYGDTAILERNGIKVGFVAAHSGGCCLNVNRLSEVTQAIQELNEQVDIVVLSFHGGAEGSNYRHVPGKTEIAWGEQRGNVEALAHAAIDAGADLVLGHGPHVLRAMEVYQERLIVYSLGNFMGYKQFGTSGGYGGTSMVVEVQIAQNGVLTGARVHPMLLDGTSRPFPDPQKAAIQQVQELSDADFPKTGVTISDDGVVHWKK